MSLVKIVNSINVAELINNLDVSRTRKSNLKVKTYYLLSVITDTNDNYKLNKATNGFHKICSDKMKKILGNTDFYFVRNLLMNPSDPIIEINGSWQSSVGTKKCGFCQGYRITQIYNSGEVVFKTIPEKMVAKIHNSITEDSINIELNNRYDFLFDQFSQHKLSLDKDVYQYVRNFGNSLLEKSKDNRYHRMQIYNLVGRWLYFINQIESGDVWKGVSERNYRFNSSITNLSKLLRPFLKCNGELLTCVDISSSQPYILSSVIQTRFYYETSTGFNLKTIYPELYNELVDLGHIDTSVSFSSNDFINYTTTHTSTTSNSHIINYYGITTNTYSINNGTSSFMWCKKLTPYEIDSITNYIQSPFHLDFYTHVLSNYNPELEAEPNRIEMRDKFKGTMMFILFEDNYNHRNNNEQIKIFQSVFPGVNNWIEKMHKLIGNDRFSYLLQRSESYLLLDVILREFNEQYPQAPLFTLHDGVLTTDRYSNELKELILKRLKEITGLQAGCKIIEHQPNSEPSEKDLETKWKKIKPINNQQLLDKKRAGVFSSNITRGKEFFKKDI